MDDGRSQRKGVIDNHDLLYVMERFGSVIGWEAAPLSRKRGIEHINPHVSRFYLENGGSCDVFHVKPVYYLHVEGDWRPLSEIASYYGNRRIDLKEYWADQLDMSYLAWLMKRMELIGGAVRIPSPFQIGEFVQLTSRRIYFTVTTVFPDPDPETTTVDGSASRSSAGETWSTIRSGAGTSKQDTSADAECILISKVGTNSFDFNLRSIFLFDTSAIPDADTISSAVLSLRGTTKADNIGATPNINIYGSTPASNTALVNADYSQVGTTAFATAISYASWSTAGYNDFTLNASGLAAISKTGVSKFGARNANYDVANVAPSGSNASSWLNCNYADNTGTASDPKLAVTHTSVVNVTHSATVLPSTLSLPTRTLSTGTTLTRSVLALLLSLPSRTLSTSAVPTPNALGATFSLPTRTIFIPDALVMPNPLSALFSLPNRTITYDMVFSVPVLTPLLSIPPITISIVFQITHTPSSLSVALAIPAPTRTGGIWDNQSKASTSFTNQSKPSTSWENQAKSPL